MTRVKPDLPVDQTHAALLMGLLFAEVRAGFAGEDWGGLRQSHFRVLSWVPEGGVNVTDLAQRVGMTKQGCGQFVSFLASTGHLSVAADPSDRRVRLVRRTPRGDRTLAEVSARIRRIEDDWASRVGVERYRVFRAVLADLVAD